MFASSQKIARKSHRAFQDVRGWQFWWQPATYKPRTGFAFGGILVGASESRIAKYHSVLFDVSRRPWVLLQIFAIAWSSASDTTVELIHWYPEFPQRFVVTTCDIGWGYRLYSSHCSCFQEWASRALGASPAINLPCCLVKNWSSFAGVFWYYNVMSQNFPWCRLCGTCNLQMHTDIDMQTHTGTHTHRQTTGTSIFARVVFSVPFCCCTCSDFEFCFCFQPFLRPWRWFFCARLRVFVDQRTIPGRGIPTPKPGRWCISRMWPCAYMVSVLRCWGFFHLDFFLALVPWYRRRFSLPSVGICRVPSPQKKQRSLLIQSDICWDWWFFIHQVRCCNCDPHCCKFHLGGHWVSGWSWCGARICPGFLFSLKSTVASLRIWSC